MGCGLSWWSTDIGKTREEPAAGAFFNEAELFVRSNSISILRLRSSSSSTSSRSFASISYEYCEREKVIKEGLGHNMTIRKSGLQKDVLNMYRRALRMVRTKPADTRPKFDLLVRYTFRTQASSVSPRQVSAIEHLLRRGARQIEMYENTAVKDCWVSQEMRDWNHAHRSRKVP